MLRSSHRCGGFRFAVLAMAAALLAWAPRARAQSGAPAQGRLNVLLITVDDLKPVGAAFGDPRVHTPNIDRLAARGTLFSRAYVQQAVCAPSRASFFTGLRPSTIGIHDLSTHFRKTVPDVVTLPQYFRGHGYTAVGVGKNYHNQLDDPLSWSVPAWLPVGDAGAFGEEYAWGSPELIARMQAERDSLMAAGNLVGLYPVEIDPATGTHLQIGYGKRFKGPALEIADVPDDALPDGKTAAKAVEMLRLLRNEPFFLAVGFIRPHLPWVAPRRDFDLYPPEEIRLPDNYFPPEDVPPIALHEWGDMRAYSDIPNRGPLAEGQALELIRGYYAATTYADRQIGRVLDELERLGLAENTVVVLWGDHGYQLGEHALWSKQTNFETSTLAPLIVSVPGQEARRTDALVEMVDVYPTLAALAHLPAPAGVEGTSLVPLLEEPARAWKSAAFSEYPRGRVMGRSMRTDRWRYTEWAEPGQSPVARELYDHRADPDENVNLAGRAGYADAVAELSRKLHAGWRAALPETL